MSFFSWFFDEERVAIKEFQCDCGKGDKCSRKLVSNSVSGRIGQEGLTQCPKVAKRISQINNSIRHRARPPEVA